MQNAVETSTQWERETLVIPERRNTDCLKWDALEKRFGDPDLIAMWVADMDFMAPRAVLDAMKTRIDHGIFGYHHAPESYFDAFIDWERNRHGYAVEREWIRFAPGVVPAVYRWVDILTQPGDACIILTPVYYPFRHAIEDTGRRLVNFDLANVNGRYTVDMDGFEAAIRANDVKLFILCSPHNPVGRVWERQELKDMLDICRRNHVFVISDEIHQDIIPGARGQIPSATVGEYDDMMVTLTSASKTFNLASLENSFVVVPDADLRMKYDQWRKYHSAGSGNLLGYVAVEAAYRQGAPWLESVLEQIRRNDARLREVLAAAHPEAVVSPLEGTYLAWVDFRKVVPAERLKHFVQDSARIAVDFGDWFGEAGRGFARFNLATGSERMEQALENLAKARV